MNSEEILRLIGLRDFAAADEALVARLQRDSRDLEALFIRANLLYSAEHYDDAASHNAAALRLLDLTTPPAAAVLAQAADIALARGLANAALPFLQQAHKLVPQDLSITRKLWRELRIRNDRQADDLFGTLLAQAECMPSSRVAALLTLLGRDRAAFADFTEAEALLRRAQDSASSEAERTSIQGERIGLALTRSTRPESLPESLIGSFMAGLPPAHRAEAEMLVNPVPLAKPDGQSATIVVTTNLTKKLVVNRAKAPPRDTLIRETLQSLSARLQPRATDKIVIYYDAPRDQTDPDHKPYLLALERIAADYGAELRVRQAAGLRLNYVDAVQRTDTPFFMLLEHDWLFEADVPTLGELADTVQRHDFIHLLRFNKRPNVAMRDDLALWREPRVTGMPMLRTLNFSNNPHLARTAKLQRDILPLIVPNASLDAINAGAGGVEETVVRHLSILQQRYGFTLAHNWGGAYVYGRENDAARLVHTGI